MHKVVRKRQDTHPFVTAANTKLLAKNNLVLLVCLLDKLAARSCNATELCTAIKYPRHVDGTVIWFMSISPDSLKGIKPD